MRCKLAWRTVFAFLFPVWVVFSSLTGGGLSSVCSAEEDLFRDQVAPILQRRCLSCHNPADHKGDFSLHSQKSAMADGYVEPGNADESYLIELITPQQGKAKMPKNADPLSPGEIAVLRKWIDAGAKWPAGLELKEAPVADLNWWSLRPLARPRVPQLDAAPSSPASSFKTRTPIDAFMQRKWNEKGLSPSPEADRRTLIRRLYFDLWGLPPSPAEIQAFVDDEHPRAYERLVDRLLASPHYGERWARHWLDVVHYADTHGYDKDKPRPNAWPYRDYVIRAFNEDKPYSRFVQEQIAGDILWPQTRDGITATGFIAAGPWDFIGHAEVPESKIDGRIARHLDRDDMVTSTLNTFCSTTIQCARCHHHKFDPIRQQHYYSLQAVFAALDRADRSYDLDPQIAQRRATLLSLRETLTAEAQSLQEQVKTATGSKLAPLEKQLAQLEKQKASGKPQPQFGYHSQIERTQNTVKWVQVDLGQATEIASILYVGCHDNYNNIGHGFGFPVRYKIEVSNDEQFRAGVTSLVDRTDADVKNPGTQPQRETAPKNCRARFIRITATKLAPRKNDYIFALAEVSVFTPAGTNAALGKRVTSKDSIQAPVRWQRKNLVDGYYYGVQAAPDLAAKIDSLRAQRDKLRDATLSAELKTKLAANERQLKEVAQALKSLPPQGKVYAGTVHHGKGNFVGTGAKGGRPRAIHVLHRGNILDPREAAQPGTIPVIEDSEWEFELDPAASEGERRVALANWLVRRDNPLAWRSIVNRVWQYHFGRGLVDSPNDFGRMGKRPTHPELLDWLAVEFRDNGQSFKKLHKLIVTSAVYRQSVTADAKQRELDAENLYLWRMNRRRLTAEEVRDAVLAVSGKLDETMFGPGFQLFVIERPQHSPHYEYDQHDPDDPKSLRRSIYRFIVRSQPDPFMTTLDCADSSASVAKREETLTALQALSLLNNKFMLRMAEHFAARLQGEADTLRGQVEYGFHLVTGRSPSTEQATQLTAYAAEFGMENLCRLLFNLNEFVFVD